MSKNLMTYLQPILDRGYIDTSTKEELGKLTDALKSRLERYYGLVPPEYEYNEDTGEYELVYEGDPEAGLDNEGEAIKTEIENIKNKIETLPTSKLEGILNQFSLVTTGRPLNYSKLIE